MRRHTARVLGSRGGALLKRRALPGPPPPPRPPGAELAELAADVDLEFAHLVAELPAERAALEALAERVRRAAAAIVATLRAYPPPPVTLRPPRRPGSATDTNAIMCPCPVAARGVAQLGDAGSQRPNRPS